MSEIGIKDQCFGVEVEMTGITREEAAWALAEYFRMEPQYKGGAYGTWNVMDPEGKTWKLVSDSSISTEQKTETGYEAVDDTDYRVEMVTPKLTYAELPKLQECVRRVRKAGAKVNSSCGIHIHLDGSNHTPRSIRNFVNIIASHNDLFYKALQIEPERMRYCKKMDTWLVHRLNQAKPKTFAGIENIWYEGYRENRNQHYHNSRYHFLNLHSFFHGHRTVELRGFNGTLHAGKIRAYVVLALALNHQALTQKSASYRKVQEENERFAMRTYLNRIGFIGDEFKNCREHLYQHLSGNAAWRYGSRENVRSHISRNGGHSNEC